MVWLLCPNMCNMLLKKNMPKSLFAWRLSFHYNSKSFHLELWKWIWILKSFGHSFYAHQWWVELIHWDHLLLSFCGHCLSISKVYWMRMLLHLMCTASWSMHQLIHSCQCINWSNYGAKFESLLLLFGFSREGLSNDIFFGVVSYQGCHRRQGNKHIFIGNNFIAKIRLGFIKIGSHCYQ